MLQHWHISQRQHYVILGHLPMVASQGRGVDDRGRACEWHSVCKFSVQSCLGDRQGICVMQCPILLCSQRMTDAVLNPLHPSSSPDPPSDTP
jgi:hypothetical protein